MEKSNEKKNTIIACLIILLLAAICAYISVRCELSYTKEALVYSREYIDVLESDNMDYVLDVASETDAYYYYHEYAEE